jgi:hypothetical protein
VSAERPSSVAQDSWLNNERNAVGSLRGDKLLIAAFLKTAAPRGANVVLVLEMAMGIGLLLGAWLARKGSFRQHAANPGAGGPACT